MSPIITNYRPLTIILFICNSRMSLQTKVRNLRSQPPRLSKIAHPTHASVVKQAPKIAGRNPRATHLNTAPGALSRSRTALPVPAVNKPAIMRNKSSSDKSHLSSTVHLNKETSKAKKSKKGSQEEGNSVVKQNGQHQKASIPDNNVSNLPRSTTATDSSHNTPQSEGNSEVNAVTAYVGGGSEDSPALALSPSAVVIEDSTVGEQRSDLAKSGSSDNNSGVPRFDTPSTATFDGVLPSDGDTPTDSIGANLPPSKPTDPWHLAFTKLKSMGVELKAMGKKMDQLDKIERDVGSLRLQMDGISHRTKGLEELTQSHSKGISDFQSSVSEIKTSLQQHDSTLDELWTYTEEIAGKADQRIREIKAAIQENIDKISHLENIKEELKREVLQEIENSAQETKKDIQKDVAVQIKKSAQSTKAEINETIIRNTHDIEYRRLQDQASRNRHNLILLGIPEHDQDSAFTQASNCFKNNLKLPKVSIDVAYRLGKEPDQPSSYARPIMVKFDHIFDRNAVWRKRNNIVQENQDKPIRIETDTPKQLREDLRILYRVQRAASQIEQYQTAEVRDYKLFLNEEEYFAWELEELPRPLRPSTLATRKTDNVLVFYSKYSVLSNHHTSPFKIRDRTFATMEQFLAYNRAKLAGQRKLIQRALAALDPVEAKFILNTLRNDHPEEWNKDLSALVTEGLHAKFRQNPTLCEYLCSTAPLTLGEASKNNRWGVGFMLDDDDVLTKARWNKQGNLLGRLLMKVRNQIIHERQLQATARSGRGTPSASQSSRPNASSHNGHQSNRHNASASDRSEIQSSQEHVSHSKFPATNTNGHARGTQPQSESNSTPSPRGSSPQCEKRHKSSQPNPKNNGK